MGMNTLDIFLFSSFNSLAGKSPLLDSGIVFFAQYFPYLLTGLFFVFAVTRILSLKERMFLVAEGFGAALLSRGLVEFIRLVVHRLRPFVADSSVIALFSESSFSFPSGHASFFFALATVVFLYDRKWGIWFYITSALIGIARVVAGVHYPSDIFGGVVLGILVGWFLYFLSRKYVKEKTIS